MSKCIDLIAGARPNFVKIAPIIRAIQNAQKTGSGLQYRLIHTGQHYDYVMSQSFFDDLGLPKPDANLGAGSGTQAEQTGAIMLGYERLLKQSRSDLCVVVGDVTSTMACAIVAQKCLVPVGHVEGGIRSGDWSMPEEINRMVTDSITNYFFTTSEFANENLRRLGVEDKRIFFVGNTMIDTLLANRARFRKPAIWNEVGLREKEYVVATLHRPANVDDPERLSGFLESISEGARGRTVVLPAHPRTAARLNGAATKSPDLKVISPLGYLEFNFLVQSAIAVITDSGGISEETTVLGIPCLTLRDTTERPETISVGTNVLVGTDPRALRGHMDNLFAGRWKKGGIPLLWDGRAGERIVSHLEQLLA